MLDEGDELEEPIIKYTQATNADADATLEQPTAPSPQEGPRRKGRSRPRSKAVDNFMYTSMMSAARAPATRARRRTSTIAKPHLPSRSRVPMEVPAPPVPAIPAPLRLSVEDRPRLPSLPPCANDCANDGEPPLVPEWRGTPT